MEAILSGVVFAALLLPLGYAALRVAGSSEDGLAGLSAALGLGWSLALPLVLIELQLGGRYLVIPVALACLAWLRPGRAALAGLRALVPDLLLPLAFAALVYAANSSDFERGPAGASLRVGFDVADRVTYALAGDEVLRARPDRLEHPLFAPLPAQYSIFPSLAGLLLRQYAGASSLPAFVVHLPVIGSLWVGVAVAGLLQQWGAAQGARRLAVLLVCLGGDLSFLASTRNHTGLERAGHFFAFHSFSAESLLYNPWVVGLPLALAVLVVAGRWLSSSRRSEWVLLALLLGALWQTKVFAFLTLMAAALLSAALLRRVRLAGLCLAGVVGGAPWLLLTLLTPGSRGGAALVPELLRPVRLSLDLNATLRWASGALGDGTALLVLGTLLFLAGGLGLRLLGLPRLARESRSDPSGLHAWIAATIAVGLCAALAVRVQPAGVDGVQFLTFAQYLLWPYAALALASLMTRRAWLAVPLVALALVSPSLSLARKLAPERLTSASALDRVRLRLGPATVTACDWLREHSAPGERLALPLTGDPEDFGLLKPLLVAGLSERRIVAYAVPLGVAPALVAERNALVASLYDAGTADEAEAARERLQAHWIWDDTRRPLRSVPAAWVPHDAAPGIRLWRARR